MQEIKIDITAEILNLIAQIDTFKGKWEALRHISPERLTALKKIATIESIGSSTCIEGVKLTDAEIEALLQGLDKNSFRSRDEEVAGYAETMDIIFESCDQIKFDENHVKQLHNILLKHSKKDVRHRGEYKKFANHVEAFDEKRKSLGVIFKTTSPFDTPKVMSTLVKQTRNAFAEKKLHPLLIIGFFIVHFLAIHPFQDSNGRLSRILTTLLLLQQGYEYVPYCSLENIIEKNKEKYYIALRRAQSTIKKDNGKLNDWLAFFLRCLLIQANRLQNKVQQEKILINTKLSALEKSILELIRAHGSLSIHSLVILTKANRNTLKLKLRELSKKGFILKHGVGKGTYYTLKVTP